MPRSRSGCRLPRLRSRAGGSVSWNPASPACWKRGIRVGSAKTELLAAYPSFASTVSGVVSDVYVINGSTGSLSFEVSKQNSDGGSNYWPDDQVDRVLWMGVTLPGASPGPIAASDGGPSTCPQND